MKTIVKIAILSLFKYKTGVERKTFIMWNCKTIIFLTHTNKAIASKSEPCKKSIYNIFILCSCHGNCNIGEKKKKET